MSNTKEKIIKIIDVVTIAIAIAICVVAFIIDGYNSIMSNPVTIDYSFVTATLLLAISTHFILSGFIQSDISRKQDKLEADLGQAVSTIIDSLHGVEVTFFEDINDVDIHIAKRISTAKSCVYDFNWQDYTATNPYHRSLPAKEYAANEIDKSIKAFCSKKSTIPRIYKEIFTFSYPKNLGKMMNHITYGDSYSCSYYDNKEPNNKFPKLQFVVIDDEEVIFVSSQYKPNLCLIRNKRIASIFCSYFDQSWELSTIIKDNANVNHGLIARINEKYS